MGLARRFNDACRPTWGNDLISGGGGRSSTTRTEANGVVDRALVGSLLDGGDFARPDGQAREGDEISHGTQVGAAGETVILDRASVIGMRKVVGHREQGRERHHDAHRDLQP